MTTLRPSLTVHLVIQEKEDNPHNPGWWRWGRPWFAVKQGTPAITKDLRWTYGHAGDADLAAKEWDEKYPNG